METGYTLQFTALPKSEGQTNIDFWANYWHISTDELQHIITMLGSSSFVKIDGFMKERKASA